MIDRRRPVTGEVHGEPKAARERVDALARQLALPGDAAPADLGERVAALSQQEQAELALRLPAEQRLELLLHATKPMALVRSLPDLELYLTVRELGVSDVLPLIALASTEQIQHMIDLESWHKDRFDPERSGAWVAVLLEAGEPALRSFLRSADDEYLSLLFAKWLRLEAVEDEDTPSVHGPGESEAGDEQGFVTPDGHYRVSPIIAEHGPASQRLLQVFLSDQPERYRRVVWGSLWELPSDLEEQALHWRESRLQEHGFPAWDEALAVYAPPEGVRAHPTPLEVSRPGALAAPRAALRVLAGRDGLTAAIERLDDADYERVLHELVTLANHLLVADAGETGDPAALRASFEKAAGYISIALARRGAESGPAASRALADVPAIELFREGYARVVELRERALKLRREGWAATGPNALRLLDPPLGQRLEALLEPRPRYFDLGKAPAPEALRDFAGIGELAETRTAVELAETLGRLFVEKLGLDVTRMFEAAGAGRTEEPRFSTLLLTLLAWHATRAELRCEPLPAAVGCDFLRTVASRRTASPDAPARAMESLLGRLAEVAELSAVDVGVMRAFSRACLEALASECSNLDPGNPMDRRFVACLLIEDPKGA